MLLNSLTVEARNLSDQTVTLVFRVNATLEATDESRVNWGLSVTILGFGTKRIPGRKPGSTEPAPANSADTRFVGGNQAPTGLRQGSNWTTSFEASYQRRDISVPENDVYLVQAKLVPVSDINESPIKTATLKMDI